MPKVSVIVPVYKAEQYLHNCIDSILNQTYTDFELILVDDGSPDKSGEICDKYAENDGRIRVIHKKNGGVSSARNEGMHAAKGEYICFVDSDDSLNIYFLQKCLELAKSYGDELIICGYNKIENNKIQKNIFSDEKYDILQRDQVIMTLVEKVLICAPWGKLYRSDIIKDNEIKFPEDMSLGEDMVFNFHYCNYISKIVIINSPLYNYIVVNENSLLNKYKTDLYSKQMTINNRLSEYIDNWQIDNNQIKKLNNYIYFCYEKILFNTFSKKNNWSLTTKLKYNKRIIKSKDFKDALKNFSGKINPILNISYKINSFLPVVLFDNIRMLILSKR